MPPPPPALSTAILLSLTVPMFRQDKAVPYIFVYTFILRGIDQSVSSVLSNFRGTWENDLACTVQRIHYSMSSRIRWPLPPYPNNLRGMVYCCSHFTYRPPYVHECRRFIYTRSVPSEAPCFGWPLRVVACYNMKQRLI